MNLPSFFRPSALLRPSLLTALLVFAGPGGPGILGAEEVVPFDGGKSEWHEGFARYDYVMDEKTHEITPFTAPAGEGFGIGDPAPGQRRCVVVAPKKAAPGNPWLWRGCYWDHQPQADVELLKRGYHVAYTSASEQLQPGPEWDAWYDFLTAKHHLAAKASFTGMSRGGWFNYRWATQHPDKVACIYADNPAADPDIMENLGKLALNDVPILEVCGSVDPLLGRFGDAIEGIYVQWGGRITMMIKEGAGHHPHSLQNAGPIADWIEQNYQPLAITTPAYVGPKATRTSYYSDENVFRELPADNLWITGRGPGFVPSYNRYHFTLRDVDLKDVTGQGVQGDLTVIEPAKAAPGKPWVFRSDWVERNDAVDLALLAKGYHIITGPVSYNADGPQLEGWNAVYKYLTDQGFSRKPVLSGRGGSAGDAYAWAIANPDKVSCIYAENPLLRSKMMDGDLIDKLAPLAKAKVPILNVCGSLDPFFASQTQAAAKRYQSLGGSLTVVVDKGRGHFPSSPNDPKAAVDFIVAKGG